MLQEGRRDTMYVYLRQGLFSFEGSNSEGLKKATAAMPDTGSGKTLTVNEYDDVIQNGSSSDLGPTPVTIGTEPRKPPKSRSHTTHLLKTKQGLIGFANGSKIAAMADTGSRKNVVSNSYVRSLDLTIEGPPSTFAIGNSKEIQSTGTVSVLWSFAENPKKTFSILCHVIPSCTYDLILGNGFLRATHTLTKFRDRLTKCLFRIANNVPHFDFLGETYQRLKGTLADEHSILAIPDTGADRNIMSLQYAVKHGFEIMTDENHRGHLQFADGSYDKTVGQVKTYWTFASGERVPVTFEVLEDCCSEVIIGEEILTEHNVFVEHGESILLTATLDDDLYILAPFDFINPWQRNYKRLMSKFAFMRAKGGIPADHALQIDEGHSEEQHRRNTWNHEYDFGTKATTIEQQLEKARRERYENEHALMSPQIDSDVAARDGRRLPSRGRMPVIPSIRTSRAHR